MVLHSQVSSLCSARKDCLDVSTEIRNESISFVSISPSVSMLQVYGWSSCRIVNTSWMMVTLRDLLISPSMATFRLTHALCIYVRFWQHFTLTFLPWATSKTVHSPCATTWIGFVWEREVDGWGMRNQNLSFEKAIQFSSFQYGTHFFFLHGHCQNCERYPWKVNRTMPFLSPFVWGTNKS